MFAGSKPAWSMQVDYVYVRFSSVSLHEKDNLCHFHFRGPFCSNMAKSRPIPNTSPLPPPSHTQNREKQII